MAWIFPPENPLRAFFQKTFILASNYGFAVLEMLFPPDKRLFSNVKLTN
jgi:hypothetical protein